MALVTRSTSASPDTGSLIRAPQLAGDLYAGEALDMAAPCYIKASDGLVYMSNATADDEAAKIDGFTARAVASGQPVTLFGTGARFGYGSSLTPGANYYLSATAGRLDTAATAGGKMPIARAINSTDVRVLGGFNEPRVGYGAAAVFISTEQTGTGSAQNVAHGLGAAPSKVLVVPTDLTPATVGQYVVTEGSHDGTNVIVTVTASKKFKVMAWL